jgi:hypothetical protein
LTAIVLIYIYTVTDDSPWAHSSHNTHLQPPCNTLAITCSQPHHNSLHCDTHLKPRTIFIIREVLIAMQRLGLLDLKSDIYILEMLHRFFATKHKPPMDPIFIFFNSPVADIDTTRLPVNVSSDVFPRPRRSAVFSPKPGPKPVAVEDDRMTRNAFLFQPPLLMARMADWCKQRSGLFEIQSAAVSRPPGPRPRILD